jgi:hypothetical protein
MHRVDLLSVQDHFQIGTVVYLVPAFSVPRGNWKSTSEQATVICPDGQEFEATAQFNLAHVNIRDPKAPMDRRWRVIVAMPDRKKDELPLGSRILVSAELRDALLPPQNA